MMATYRTIRMAFWNNPAIEDIPPEQKLLFLYLFTSPHTNNLGVLSVTVRKIAFEAGLDEDDVREFLEDLEFDGHIAHAAPRPALAVPGAPAVPPETPAFRTYSEAEKEHSRTLAGRALDALRGNGEFSTDMP